MSGSTVGVDLRTAEEIATNPAPGSVHIELSMLAENFKTKLPNKDLEIFLFCEKGGRAEKAKKFLEAEGYKKVKNIGSWREWNELK